MRWEKQRSQSAVAHPAKDKKDSKKDAKSKEAASAPQVGPWPRSRQSAQAKVSRLQADADAVEKENLERALSRTQTQAVVPPVSAEITSTKGFIDREKKRLGAAEEAVLAAVQHRDECIKALADGERRLEELQLQEQIFVAPVPDAQAKLIRLRAQVAELQGSMKVFQRHSNQRVCPVEDMPGLIPAELSGWMEDRQANVQEALLQGNHTSHRVEFDVDMVEMTRPDISDDEFRSRVGRFALY